MKYYILSLTAILLLFAFPLRTISADSDNNVTKDDVVIGTDTDDTIDTGEGDDIVSGGAGNDKIKGGPGDDYIIGGPGDDIVTDGPGSDYIILGVGNDTFVYYVNENTDCIDLVEGGEGIDTLVIVMDNIDDLMKNEIIKYYEQQNLVGADIVQLGQFDITLGVSQFEHIVFATGFTF